MPELAAGEQHGRYRSGHNRLAEEQPAQGVRARMQALSGGGHAVLVDDSAREIAKLGWGRP